MILSAKPPIDVYLLVMSRGTVKRNESSHSVRYGLR
jgi:hypothetical protein